MWGMRGEIHAGSIHFTLVPFVILRSSQIFDYTSILGTFLKKFWEHNCAASNNIGVSNAWSLHWNVQCCLLKSVLWIRVIFLSVFITGLIFLRFLIFLSTVLCLLQSVYSHMFAQCLKLCGLCKNVNRSSQKQAMCAQNVFLYFQKSC